MKITLIPTNDLNKELFTRVLDLLQAVPGVNKFESTDKEAITIPEDIQEYQEITDKESFEAIKFLYPLMHEFSEHNKNISFPLTRTAVRWRDLFRIVEKHRVKYEIPVNEFVILLTPQANKKNWFAAIDEKNSYNGFIHTADWEHYLSCDPAIPISFEVVALILQKYIFNNYTDILKFTHERAIGCVSDLCMKKSDIILKMRTADICPACMQKVQSHLTGPEIHHALAIMESLRLRMLYAQNFKQNSPPSRLTILRGGRIYLTDYSNIEIKLPALEKALYILYLRYPDGIFISSLNEHREELYEIYSNISTRGLLKDMKKRIDDMINITREQVSIKISRIKRAFTEAIGETLADYYIIQGEIAERKLIKLDRVLVEYCIT